jgi:hypothetical protein
MNKLLVFFLFSTVFLCGCVSSEPGILTLPVSANVNLYYVPMTEWQPVDGTSQALLDFSYRNEEGSPVICNVSVFSQEELAKEISDAYIEAGNVKYPLGNIRLLLTRPEKNEFRITTVVSISDFLEILKGEDLTFNCLVDGRPSRYAAPKAFYRYGEQFRAATGNGARVF